MKPVQLCVLALCFSSLAQADCFNIAGRAFGISPALLKSIAIKESNLNLSAINRANRNRTEDVCMMQINSVHFARLSQLGVTRARLLSEDCTCVATGAWVLHGLFRQYGRSWDTVGMYNAGPSRTRQKIRSRYASEVRRIYQTLHQQAELDQQEELFANR